MADRISVYLEQLREAQEKQKSHPAVKKFLELSEVIERAERLDKEINAAQQNIAPLAEPKEAKTPARKGAVMPSLAPRATEGHDHASADTALQ